MSTLHLLDAYGIEIEYMIVDRETLAVRPIADVLLEAVAGPRACDYEAEPVAWSNELVLHLIELKMREPSPSLAGWAGRFQAAVADIERILEPHGATLLPGGVHPTMDPAHETRLWPHDNGEIYAAYDRIFGCQRHGWANLQSVHVNLPFSGDEEFGRLHAACRAVLPLLPALAASSPVLDGRTTGRLDNRLHVYATHQARIPAATGAVIPEPVWTRRDYEARVFAPMFAAIAPHDPDGLLQQEFLNARGAIARFCRDAIEIRLLDVQEHPAADLAISLLVTAVIRAVVEERWAPLDAVRALPTASLRALLDRTIESAERTLVDDAGLLAVFGADEPLEAGELWRRLARAVRGDDADWQELGPHLEPILERGPLARRMLDALGPDPTPDRIATVYRELQRCLVEGRAFAATGVR